MFKALDAGTFLVEGKGTNVRVIVRPTFAEGTTDSDDPYVLGTYASALGDQVIHHVKSRIWLKRRGITVSVVFEGQVAAPGQPVEDFENSVLYRVARSICLSVKDEPQTRTQ
ncbi:MAG: hypothetical protein ABUL60_23095 [Myxococcales bacterium]